MGRELLNQIWWTIHTHLELPTARLLSRVGAQSAHLYRKITSMCNIWSFNPTHIVFHLAWFPACQLSECFFRTQALLCETRVYKYCNHNLAKNRVLFFSVTQGRVQLSDFPEDAARVIWILISVVSLLLVLLIVMIIITVWVLRCRSRWAWHHKTGIQWLLDLLNNLKLSRKSPHLLGRNLEVVQCSRHD